jgi:hypothetical protein
LIDFGHDVQHAGGQRVGRAHWRIASNVAAIAAS